VLAAARAEPSPPPAIALPPLPSLVPSHDFQTVPYHMSRSHVSGPLESLSIKPEEESKNDAETKDSTVRSSSLARQVSSKIHDVNWHGFFRQGSLRRTESNTDAGDLAATSPEKDVPVSKCARFSGVFSRVSRSSTKAGDGSKREPKPRFWFQNSTNVDKLAFTQLPPF
jgi:hypothetical protein